MRFKRQYPIDLGLFRKIDLPWKAYFLGWLFADGNISPDLGRVALKLQTRDRSVLEYFSRQIYDQVVPMVREKPGPMTSPRNGKEYVGRGNYSLRVNGKEIGRTLFTNGLQPRKSLTMDFPTEQQVPLSLVWHFIRGYFEGDGCVALMPNGAIHSVRILATRSFLGVLQALLLDEGIPSRIVPDGKLCRLDIFGISNVGAFGALIYRDAPFYLERKHALLVRVSERRFCARKCNKTSSFIGVNLDKSTGRYVARAAIDGVRYRVGIFDREEQAHEARIGFLRDQGVNVEGVAA